MDWKRHHNGYDEGSATAKRAYHAAATKVFRQVAKIMGGTFDIRTNRGGPAVTGETILHGDDIYVMIGGSASLGLMARTCKGRKDYTGGPNNWLPVELMDDPKALADRLMRISGRVLAHV